VKTFKEFIKEDNMSGSGGVFGDYSSSTSSGDFYAQGDTRFPYIIGAYTRYGKIKKKKKRKSRRKKKKVK
jgi:hypothetical protein